MITQIESIDYADLNKTIKNTDYIRNPGMQEKDSFNVKAFKNNFMVSWFPYKCC